MALMEGWHRHALSVSLAARDLKAATECPMPGPACADQDAKLCSKKVSTWKDSGYDADPRLCAAAQRPNSDSPGCSSGRRPCGQENLRSSSRIGRSLMLAWRCVINPCSLGAIQGGM